MPEAVLLGSSVQPLRSCLRPPRPVPSPLGAPATDRSPLHPADESTRFVGPERKTDLARRPTRSGVNGAAANSVGKRALRAGDPPKGEALAEAAERSRLAIAAVWTSGALGSEWRRAALSQVAPRRSGRGHGAAHRELNRPEPSPARHSLEGSVRRVCVRSETCRDGSRTHEGDPVMGRRTFSVHHGRTRRPSGRAVVGPGTSGGATCHGPRSARRRRSFPGHRLYCNEGRPHRRRRNGARRPAHRSAPHLGRAAPSTSTRMVRRANVERPPAARCQCARARHPGAWDDHSRHRGI